MASAEVKAAGSDWILSNPWPWLLVGLAAASTAFLLARVVGDEFSGVRFVLLVVGLGTAGAAVGLQLHWPGARLSPVWHRRAGLGVVFANALVALVAVLFFAIRLREYRAEVEWLTGGETFFWLLVALWSGFAALYLPRRVLREEAREGVESAAILTLAAAVAYLACWALFLGVDRQDEWDSARLFLAVLALAAFAAAPLLATSRRVRRRAVSALILFHLGGIATAAASNPPGPWLFAQLWGRLYRPYLEFLYLNNAYRFYSPEPLPSHQLWFRVEYERKGEDRRVSHWFKLPNLDDGGRPLYPLALQYERRLMLADAATRTDPPLPAETPAGPAAYYRRRYLQTPQGYAETKGVLGAKDQPTSALQVPFLRQMVPPVDPRLRLPEYSPPDAHSRLLLASYARHIARRPHPKYPDAKPVHVKIYRVVHWIVSPQELRLGLDPQDLTNYQPYYQGAYDPRGRLLDPQEPFLYWLLPSVRAEWGNRDSPVMVYAFAHAGDAEAALRESHKRGGHPIAGKR